MLQQFKIDYSFVVLILLLRMQKLLDSAIFVTLMSNHKHLLAGINSWFSSITYKM